MVGMGEAVVCLTLLDPISVLATGHDGLVFDLRGGGGGGGGGLHLSCASLSHRVAKPHEFFMRLTKISSISRSPEISANLTKI